MSASEGSSCQPSGVIVGHNLVRVGEHAPSGLRVVSFYFRASLGEDFVRVLPLTLEGALHGP